VVVAGCGGAPLGSKLDASAVPVALAWARANFVAFDCRRAVALEVRDYDEPRDCADQRADARRDRVRSVHLTGVVRVCNPAAEIMSASFPKSDCVRVTIRDISCGGTSNHRRVLTHDARVVDVYLRHESGSWRVSAVGTYRLDSALSKRRCPARLKP
jgi:hypothetical protein